MAAAAAVIFFAGCASLEDLPEPAVAESRQPEGLEQARVDRVVDGDTVVLDDGRRVRLVGINTPESDECYYDEATALLRDLVDGVTVGLQIDRNDTDQFDRTLRHLWTDDGHVGEAMVRGGAALAQTFGDDDLHEQRLDEAQQDARAAARGLWSPDACGQSTGGSFTVVGVEENPRGPDEENLADEWVDIRNDGDQIELTGWSVRDGSSANRFEFPRGFTIESGAEIRIRTGCGTDTDTDLYWCNPNPVWNNSGDDVFVLDPSGNVVATFSY